MPLLITHSGQNFTDASVLEKPQRKRLNMRKKFNPKIGRNAVSDETKNIIMRDGKSSLE